MYNTGLLNILNVLEFKKDNNKWYKGIVVSLEPLYILDVKGRETYIDTSEIKTHIRFLNKEEPVFKKLTKIAEKYLNSISYAESDTYF